MDRRPHEGTYDTTPNRTEVPETAGIRSSTGDSDVKSYLRPRTLFVYLGTSRRITDHDFT